MINIAYAVKNGNLVHISDVSYGLKCGCICAECGAPLLARKGMKRVHHFAHIASTSCNGGIETTLHKVAKELFLEMSSILIPEYVFKKHKRLKTDHVITYPEISLAKGGLVQIESVQIEATLNSIRPDVIVSALNKKLIVEIAVNHPVNKQKLRKIRLNNLCAIEIQLDIADRFLTRKQLKNKLETDLKSKKWLYHPNQLGEELKFIQMVREHLKKNRAKSKLYSTNHRPKTNSYISAPPYAEKNNTNDDRMIYEFFLKYGRQPTEDEFKRLHSILYRRPQYYPKK